MPAPDSPGMPRPQGYGSRIERRGFAYWHAEVWNLDGPHTTSSWNMVTRWLAKLVIWMEVNRRRRERSTETSRTWDL